MRPVTEQAIQELVREMVAELSPEAIYLFGSRAKGAADKDSDLDLMVIVTDPFDEKHSRQRELSRLWNIAARSRLPVDILLFSRREVEEWQGSGSHVISRAIREGRALYAAA